MKRSTEKFLFDKSDRPKLIRWAERHNPCVILDSHAVNNPQYPGGFTYDLVIGVNAIEELISKENSFEK